MLSFAIRQILSLSQPLPSSSLPNLMESNSVDIKMRELFLLILRICFPQNCEGSFSSWHFHLRQTQQIFQQPFLYHHHHLLIRWKLTDMILGCGSLPCNDDGQILFPIQEAGDGEEQLWVRVVGVRHLASSHSLALRVHSSEHQEPDRSFFCSFLCFASAHYFHYHSLYVTPRTKNTCFHLSAKSFFPVPTRWLTGTKISF